MEEAEGDFDDTAVRVPLALPVPVFEAVIVDVCVAVFLTESVCGGERELLGLPVEVREALGENVSVFVADDVLEGIIECEPLGQLDDVFEELIELVTVLDAVVVFVAVVVPVMVFDTIEETLGRGLVLDVLDGIPLFVAAIVGFIVVD